MGNETSSNIEAATRITFRPPMRITTTPPLRVRDVPSHYVGFPPKRPATFEPPSPVGDPMRRGIRFETEGREVVSEKESHVEKHIKSNQNIGFAR